MNNARRAQINSLHKKLGKLNEMVVQIVAKAEEYRDALQELIDAEQEQFDNMSEAAQEGTRGETCTDAISHMENALHALDNLSCIEELGEAQEELDNAQQCGKN